MDEDAVFWKKEFEKVQAQLAQAERERDRLAAEVEEYRRNLNPHGQIDVLAMLSRKDADLATLRQAIGMLPKVEWATFTVGNKNQDEDTWPVYMWFGQECSGSLAEVYSQGMAEAIAALLRLRQGEGERG